MKVTWMQDDLVEYYGWVLVGVYCCLGKYGPKIPRFWGILPSYHKGIGNKWNYNVNDHLMVDLDIVIVLAYIWHIARIYIPTIFILTSQKSLTSLDMESRSHTSTHEGVTYLSHTITIYLSSGLYFIDCVFVCTDMGIISPTINCIYKNYIFKTCVD